MALTGDAQDLRARARRPRLARGRASLPRRRTSPIGRLRRETRSSPAHAGRRAQGTGRHDRPLLISRLATRCCSTSHRTFAEWIDEAHDLLFSLDKPGFADALTDRQGRPVALETAWPLLDRFFDGEMHRQSVVPGAIEALKAIGETADIVILTNIGDQYRANRVEQLGAFDIRHRVLCNQGGKGRPVLELIEEMRPSVTVFVDDLAVHHESVNKHAPTCGGCKWSPSRASPPTPRRALRPSTDRPMGRSRFVDPGALRRRRCGAGAA
jgi:hypothetical protein